MIPLDKYLGPEPGGRWEIGYEVRGHISGRFIALVWDWRDEEEGHGYYPTGHAIHEDPFCAFILALFEVFECTPLTIGCTWLAE